MQKAFAVTVPATLFESLGVVAIKILSSFGSTFCLSAVALLQSRATDLRLVWGNREAWLTALTQLAVYQWPDVDCNTY